MRQSSVISASARLTEICRGLLSWVATLQIRPRKSRDLGKVSRAVGRFLNGLEVKKGFT